MIEIIKKFEVPYLQILDESGKVKDKKAIAGLLFKEDIKKIYWLMILSRAFDTRAIAMQRQGKIYTYASLKGQEAAQVASAYAMEKGDFAFPTFREHGMIITRGGKIENLFLYYKGDERGSCEKGANVFPPSIPIASQILHAAGAGMAMAYKKSKSAAVAYFGDGATSKGDFHEALNFAGVFHAHAVFLCQNNQWAISLPVSQQTAAETIAQKAIAYGIKGIRVDGNDIFAVYKAMKEALEDAYKGNPTLLECLTYRLGDHTTSDDASKYRSQKEVEAHEKSEPVQRLRDYMYAEKIMTKAEDKNLLDKAEREIDAAVKRFEAIKPYPPEDTMNYLYSSLPESLRSELEEIKNAGVK